MPASASLRRSQPGQLRPQEKINHAPALEAAACHKYLSIYFRCTDVTRSFAAIWLRCPPLLRPPTRDIESSVGFRTMGSSDAFRTMELGFSMMVSATEFWRFPVLEF
jgi:hypothetical protein